MSHYNDLYSILIFGINIISFTFLLSNKTLDQFVSNKANTMETISRYRYWVSNHFINASRDRALFNVQPFLHITSEVSCPSCCSDVPSCCAPSGFLAVFWGSFSLSYLLSDICVRGEAVSTLSLWNSFSRSLLSTPHHPSPCLWFCLMCVLWCARACRLWPP